MARDKNIIGTESIGAESEIQSKIMLAVGALPGVRLFRNNTGAAWAGQVVERNADFITLKHYRLVNFGLCEGSSDLIGWNRQGLFTALEVKTDSGRVSASQERFITRVLDSGGLAGVVRSPADAARLFI